MQPQVAPRNLFTVMLEGAGLPVMLALSGAGQNLRTPTRLYCMHAIGDSWHQGILALWLFSPVLQQAVAQVRIAQAQGTLCKDGRLRN
jgi:hypothetical protein